MLKPSKFDVFQAGFNSGAEVDDTGINLQVVMGLTLIHHLQTEPRFSSPRILCGVPCEGTMQTPEAPGALVSVVSGFSPVAGGLGMVLALGHAV